MRRIKFGWDDQKFHTHELLTKKAFKIAKKNNPNINLKDSAVKNLLIYSEKPDHKDDFESGVFPFICYRHFFYILKGKHYGKNYINGDDTAVSRFKLHAKNALLFYKKIKLKNPCAELGRACHFLEDLGQPFMY